MARVQSVRDVISFCMERKTRMLMVPPDTIFGDGSIFNMRQYTRNKTVSVAASHLRVNEEPFLKSFNAGAWNWPISNSTLVSAAQEHAHQSLTDSYCHLANGTRHGGISITKIHAELHTIIHYRPTPYLVWFEESDRQYFSRDIQCIGHWDQEWPKHLAETGRLRIFSSSDLFFALELTPPHMNRIEVGGNDAFGEDSALGPFWMRCLVGGLFG